MKIALIGVPMDLGASRRGVDMGPSAIRVTNVAKQIRELGYEVNDTGDIDVPLPEESAIGDRRQKYTQSIQDVCEALCQRVVDVMKTDALPVVLGGDHSLAMGSVAGVAKHYRTEGQAIGLIWFDAHGDINTPESSTSGNIHGMPVAHLLGLGDGGLATIGGFKLKVQASNTVLIGSRDLDPGEQEIIAQTGVRCFTMKDIDEQGIGVVIKQAIAIASAKTTGVHVSFDIDVLDPSVVDGTGTPVTGGLTYREAHLALEKIAESKQLTSLDLVEVNPILDTKNATAKIATGLILSALGKQILTTNHAHAR